MAPGALAYSPTPQAAQPRYPPPNTSSSPTLSTPPLRCKNRKRPSAMQRKLTESSDVLKE